MVSQEEELSGPVKLPQTQSRPGVKRRALAGLGCLLGRLPEPLAVTVGDCLLINWRTRKPRESGRLGEQWALWVMKLRVRRGPELAGWSVRSWVASRQEGRDGEVTTAATVRVPGVFAERWQGGNQGWLGEMLPGRAGK